MSMQCVVRIVLFFFVSFPLFAHERMSFTTKSARARELYEQGMVNVENVLRTPAIESFNAAIKADPKFAMAHVGLFLMTRDPAAERRHVTRARVLLSRTSAGERLFIRWATAQKENDLITAIAAMNDFVAMFPKEKRYLTFFARWLFFAENYERTIDIIENYVVKVDPDYVFALNYLGYSYAKTGRYDQGIAAMRRTTELRPKEPNPYDSLAELLRQAGRFEEALAQYQRAYELAEGFSSIAIADTLAMMGRYREARAEYARGPTLRLAARTALDFAFQNAVSYIRERDLAGADQAFLALAAEAHAAGVVDAESSAHAAMAMYARQPTEALAHLADAEAALQHSHPLSPTRLEEEIARTLRLRATWLCRAGRMVDAHNVLDRLAAMAENSRDVIVRRAYHGARGEVLLTEKKFSEAIAAVAEDPYNAFSRHNLILALEKSDQAEGAKKERARFLAEHQPGIEHAIVRNRLTE
jgi:hypothetical protein